MFFDTEMFDKFSIYGNYVNQIKLSDSNANCQNFNLLTYLKDCNGNRAD